MLQAASAAPYLEVDSFDGYSEIHDRGGEFDASRIEDIDAFERQVLDQDPSFNPEESALARRRLAELRATPPISDARFELELARVAALADNGHTLLLTPRWTGVYNRLPLRFLSTADGLWVAGAEESHSPLVGCRVRRLSGHTWLELRDAWAEHQGGEPGWREQFLYYFMESPEVMFAAGLAPSPNGTHLELDDCGAHWIDARSDLDPLTGIEALIPPARQIELFRQGFIKGSPLYLEQPDEPFRLVPLPDQRAVLLQFRANADFGGDRSAEQFAARAGEELRRLSPRFVIVDQRFNPGGDLTTTRQLMQELPEIVGPNGHIFILVSGRTFSAGISSTAYAKQAAGDRATVIGEPPGDRLEFWAEGDLVTLPHSGTSFLFARERHNYRTGCPEPDCHAAIRNHPIRIESLRPDHVVAPSYADFVAGRDPLMDKALDLIEQKGNEREQ